MSSELGLEGLTIGVLAARVGMSKSGLYAHFDSKESLQLAVLDAGADRFKAVVLAPAFQSPRGRPRLEAIFANWLRWEHEEYPGGCPFLAAAADFDDRPGPVRDAVAGYVTQLSGAIARSATYAIEVGDLAPDADCELFAFETWGILLAYQQYRRLLGAADAETRAWDAFRSLLDRNSATP